jgi:hypothetical protein
MVKRFSFAVIGTLVVLGLAACGSGPNEPGMPEMPEDMEDPMMMVSPSDTSRR